MFWADDVPDYTDKQLFMFVDKLKDVKLGQYFPEPLIYKNLDTKHPFDLREKTPVQFADFKCAEYEVASSARALEQQLKDKGYQTKEKFSHTYKMSEDMRKRILHDGYVLEYFLNIMRFSNNLKDISDEGTKQIIKSKCVEAWNVAYYYAQHICANNPGVYTLTPNKYLGSILNFILGVGYEFHPLDIRYNEEVFFSGDQAAKEEKLKKLRAFKTRCKEHGIDMGCLVMAPENMSKLDGILTR